MHDKRRQKYISILSKEKCKESAGISCKYSAEKDVLETISYITSQ